MCTLSGLNWAKTNLTEGLFRNYLDRVESFLPRKCFSSNTRGQAVVEFVFAFIILLVVAWIPADFGLAFYTGQLALNASREGARIAAAERTLASGSCLLGSTCNSATGVLRAAADRMSSALLPGGTVQLEFPFSGASASCDQTVRVTISGNYNYFFYQMLHLMGASSVPDQVNIVRRTVMRWEHQC